MSLDDLLEEVGSFGKFQIILLFLVLFPQLCVSYNMLFMAYGALVPDWWCIDTDVQLTNLTKSNASEYQYCLDSNSTCHRVYDDSFTTVVSEWDLVCERTWISPFITSIQMIGVLVGSLIGGQCAGLFGRKKTFFSSLVLQSLFTICIVFVQSWHAFIVVRFFIGISIGVYLAVYLFPVEFIGSRYRPLLTVVPWWATGVCFLSLSTWLLQNWRYVHIVAGVSTAPFLLGWFIVPESVRWLAVKGNIKQAEIVIEKIARMNGKLKPANTTSILLKITDEERQRNQGGKKYTYLHLYKGYRIAKHTIALHIIWLCYSASYYGFAFGVGKFSGNYYLNQFYMNIILYPVVIPVILAMNRFGRRFVMDFLVALGTLCCIAVIVVQYTVAENVQGVIITGLSLSTRLCVGQAWASLEVLTTESYPTVIRILGYGAASTSARIGGIIAPFIFAATDNKMVPYLIVVFLLGLSGIISYCCLPETLGRALEDILPDNQRLTENKDGKDEVEIAFIPTTKGKDLSMSEY